MADKVTQFDADDPAGPDTILGPRFHQRILSQAGSGAMAWLSTIPYRFNTRMTTVEFRTACQLGLGIPLEVLRGVTHCFAGHPIDQYGLHFTTTACGSRSRDPVRTGAWRTKRHDLIRDELGRIAQQCGVRVELERSGLPGIPNPATRCDLVLYDFPEKERHTLYGH